MSDGETRITLERPGWNENAGSIRAAGTRTANRPHTNSRSGIAKNYEIGGKRPSGPLTTLIPTHRFC